MPCWMCSSTRRRRWATGFADILATSCVGKMRNGAKPSGLLLGQPARFKALISLKRPRNSASQFRNRCRSVATRCFNDNAPLPLHLADCHRAVRPNVRMGPTTRPAADGGHPFGTRHVRGIADPLALEERLASVLSDGIAPRLVPDIEILPWRSTNILAVQVYPSPSRPHCLKAGGIETGVYVRVGSTNRRADDELVAELRRASLGKSFDEQALPALDSEALDLRADEMIE
jgi:hypothetical protein